MRIDFSGITPLKFQLAAVPVLLLLVGVFYLLGRRASRRTGIPAWKYVMLPSAASTLNQGEKLIAFAATAGGMALLLFLLQWLTST